MTSKRNSSSSYAYYSFPPTPSRNSPSTVKSSEQSSPQTARSTKSTGMAPSPAAGKGAKGAPETPTKAGKNPASSTTPTLGKGGDQAKDTASSAQKKTPGKPPKLGASKATPKSGTTDSPKLPPRPKEADKPAEDVKGKTPASEAGTEESEASKIGMNDNDPEETPGKITQQAGAESSAAGDTDLSEAAPDPIDDDADDEDTVAGARDTVDDTAEGAADDEGEETDTGDAQDTAGGAGGGATAAAGGAADQVASAKDTAGKATHDAADGEPDKAVTDAAAGAKDTTDGKPAKAAADGAKGTAEGAADTSEETAEGAADTAEETAEGVTDEVAEGDEAVDGVTNEVPEGEEAVDGVKDTAEDAADEVEDALPEVPLSILRGLEVGEGGQIIGPDGEPLGQLDEGDPEDLIGQTIGEDGEILDEDGDVIGRCSILPEKEKEIAQKMKEEAEAAEAGDAADQVEGAADEAGEAAKTQVPDIGTLEGLKVGDDGEILDSEGKAVGKITEGDPEDFIGQEINAEGEVLDEDGDVIGRAEVLPQEVKNAGDEAKELTPDLSIIEGKKLNKKGNILDDEGEVLAKLVEGDPKECTGKVPNEKGEILDDDGKVIGKVEIVHGEAADEAMKELHPELAKAAQGPDLSIIEGKKLNKKGNIIDDEGEVLAKLVEGDPKECAGKIPNEKGEILDDDGKVIGKVEIVHGEAADEAMKELHPEPAEAVQGPSITILEGLKVNKKGEVLDEEGEPIGRLIQGEIADVAGKKINEKGEIVDEDGNVIGKVELLKAEEAADAAQDAAEEAKGAAEEAAQQGPDFSLVEGLKVNKKGEVINEDGDVIARLAEGYNAADVAGKKLNDKGEVVDSEGNVIGKVEMIPQEGEEEAEETGPELPPLSILEGLKCNKYGKIVDANGNPVGELIEGDPKKLSKMGATCDEEGQFWDGKGKVIGRARTLPQEDEEEEAPFAGLEGLIVVKDGWVEDENANRVGQIVEGDPKKLVGRRVDEDGDVIDKRGNVVGHAERYEEPAEEEAPPLDLSILNGLTVNKQGNVIGPEGVPIARLVEGNPKELAGRKIDAQGQIWNDAGQVVGRCELIPESEREAKPEGPFAGLENPHVVENGLVEDEEGNVIGKIVEGDAKRLIGRQVDEDGDINDKYGNTIGHAEPYEIPEEEVVEVDLSSLAGKIVNKQGNVIGPEGVPIARLVEGNPKELAGRKIDAQGQIWNDAGQVVGRCELIPESEREAKPEGPFAGLENPHVVENGLVEDEDENVIGKIVEGDAKRLIGRQVDEDGDINDKYGNTIGHAEPYEIPEEELVEEDLSSLAGKTVNKQGNVVDEHGTIFGRIREGDPKALAGRKVDGKGQIWSDDGKVIGYAELIPGGEQAKGEGPFSGFDTKVVVKDGLVHDGAEQVIGRVVEGDPKVLMGRQVDDDGDIVDKNGNVIGKAERWELEEKERHINPMSGHKVNKEGEVRDEDGNLLGMLTEGDLRTLIGFEVDDNGYVVDNDGNRVGACTLMENLQEDEGPSEEELAAARAEEENREIARKMCGILQQTLEKMEPILKQITEVSCDLYVQIDLPY